MDTSYDNHDNFWGYAVAIIALGWVEVMITYHNQNINTWTSNNTKLVIVSDMLPQMIWMLYSIKVQGYKYKIWLHQDNTT